MLDEYDESDEEEQEEVGTPLPEEKERLLFPSLGMKELAALLGKAQTTEAKALVLRAVLQRKRKTIWHMALRFTRDPILAEEAAQEVSLSLWKHFADGKEAPAYNLNSWVNTVARNSIQDYMRTELAQTSPSVPSADEDDERKKGKRRGKSIKSVYISDLVPSEGAQGMDGDSDDGDEFNPDPAQYIPALVIEGEQEEAAEEMLRKRLLDAAVSALPQKARDVYSALYVREMTEAQYAKSVGISADTARKRHERLRELLTKKVCPKTDTPAAFFYLGGTGNSGAPSNNKNKGGHNHDPQKPDSRQHHTESE